LHLFIEHVPEGRLRETFNNLGVRLTVRFDHPAQGRRRSVPASAELLIGGDGIRLPVKTSEPALSGAGSLGIVNRGDRI
jgi:hypothetical protein